MRLNSKKETQKMRKVNMRIFPIYKKLAWDYLFFYTIDFLFLTQVKGISAANVVLKSTFNAFFGIFMQIPANIIVEFLGRKNGIILGNILNCFYMVIIMLSRNLVDLIFAELICSIAFSIKNIAEPSLLNESIPPSRYKSKIYSKISAKGAAGYYLFGLLSKIIAGFLFPINGYLPFICSLVVLLIVTILSLGFIEPVEKKKKNINELLGKKQLKDVQEGFIYVLKSERLKALILCAALISSLLTILNNYYVSLLEDLEISSIIIGTISAIATFISSYASKKQEEFHKKFRNKTLTIISFIISITTIIAGICGLKTSGHLIWLVIIVIMNFLRYFGHGMYYTIIDRYLRNFTNEKIDTKIFATCNLFSGIIRVITGFSASFLLDKTTTANCMIIVGIIFTIVYLLMQRYMSKRVGLKPEEYSKEEVKYDETRGTVLFVS